MLRLHFFGLVVLALLLASCSSDFFEQTVEIDPPAYEKQLVLHEFIADTDGSLRVELTRNFGILEDVPVAAYRVGGATLRWYDNGQAVTTLSPLPDSPWIYMGLPGAFQTGHTYEIRAEHPDFPSLRAAQTLPPAALVDSVVFRQNGGINSNGDELQAFDVYLRDHPGRADYYEIQLLSTQYQFTYQFDDNGNLLFDSLGYPVIADTIGFYSNTVYPDEPEDPNVEYGDGNGLFIADATFEGQRYKFSFRTSGSFSGFPGQGYYVIVRAVTSEYYQYALSRYRKDEAEDNPLAEPVAVFGNIENGLGMFGLFSQQEFRVF